MAYLVAAYVLSFLGLTGFMAAVSARRRVLVRELAWLESVTPHGHEGSEQGEAGDRGGH